MINKFYKKIKSKQTRCNQKKDITFSELKNNLENDVILLDVRSIQEYNEGHLEGAIHLAEYEIVDKYGKIIPNKEEKIIVYCQNGGRSKKAVKILKKLGYKNVYNLCGGLDSIN